MYDEMLSNATSKEERDIINVTLETLKNQLKELEEGRINN